MNYLERKLQILDYLASHGGVGNINSLCKKMFFSRSTLRRDLIMLESEGLINRHHGGITLTADSAVENSIEVRRMKNQDKKAAIAKATEVYIHDNMVIFLDSSSTISYLIPILKRHRNLTIITNGANIATQLNTASSIRCYICPGFIKHKSLSIIGEYASDFISNFRAEIAFFSCKSISEHGIFEGDDNQALIKRHMLRNSNHSILLCDNSKEYSTGYFKLADFTDIDCIITNGAFSDELTKFIGLSSCKVVEPS